MRPPSMREAPRESRLRNCWVANLIYIARGQNRKWYTISSITSNFAKYMYAGNLENYSIVEYFNRYVMERCLGYLCFEKSA